MDNRKRLLVVILILLTIVLGGASIFVSQLLQNSQAPANSNASGFGEAVNKKYFDDFSQAFLTRGCFSLISDSTVAAYSPKGFDQLEKYTYTITNEAPQTKNPLNCTISLNNSSKEIDLSVHTYDKNSGIDPTAEALFARINSNIAKVELQAINKDANYFFGSDSSDSKLCRMNFFNSRNDFEYITLVYKNFNSSCSSLKDLNSEIEYVLNKSVENLIESVINPNPVSFNQ